jgi:hypothetical protein
MKKKLVICGDSFNYGIGCVNMNTQPYGVLTSNYFNWDLVRLARGSASNYVIHLQGMYAADMIEKPHLIVLGQTSYDRIEWFNEHAKDTHNHSLKNLNYHMYPPHHTAYPHHDSPMPFYLQDKEYNPYILSEQVGGIDDCLKVRKSNPTNPYYKRLNTEPTPKLQLICDYYLKVFDYEIKRNYDIGTLTKAYYYIKRQGINCIIATVDKEEFSKFVDEKDLLSVDWGQLSLKYPDTIGSLHTSEEGHSVVANALIEKIKELNLG